jgi:hypothetical protein
MFNEIENSQYFSLCLFFLEDYLELNKPHLFCLDKETLVADWHNHGITLQINMNNLDTELYVKNSLDHRTNLYNYGRRYLLKKHIHLTIGFKNNG